MATLEVVVFDQAHPCSYLPERTARLPHRHPVRPLAPAEFDQRLAEGDRRTGVFLYRTQCAECQACEPIRLDLDTFRPNATQRRELRRGDALLEVRLGEPKVDRQRIDLFNLHRRQRALDHGEPAIDDEAYGDFLVHSCVPTWELTYWHAGKLVAVAIADAGQTSLSAVYCFYDPRFRGASLGTYSVLKLVELGRQTGRRYLYLGFYIAESPHMSYKARYHPHERRVRGTWQKFA
ncbi:MAG: arginyltransferase [Pirellulaceae bacterium]